MTDAEKVIAWAKEMRAGGLNTAQINVLLREHGWEFSVYEGYEDTLYLHPTDDES